MESDTILIDTSVLIDYFRKKNPNNTFLFQLAEKHDFCISIITEFEFLIGFSDENLDFAKEIIKEMKTIEINQLITDEARMIYKRLKKINKLIPFADLLIAASASYYKLPFATLNKKHFINIEGLELL